MFFFVKVNAMVISLYTAETVETQKIRFTRPVKTN